MNSLPTYTWAKHHDRWCAAVPTTDIPALTATDGTTSLVTLTRTNGKTTTHTIGLPIAETTRRGQPYALCPVRRRISCLTTCACGESNHTSLLYILDGDFVRCRACVKTYGATAEHHPVLAHA